MSDSRSIAFDVLYKIETEDAYSSLLLQSKIRENGLSRLDSSFVSALVYGVLERKLTLDFIVRQYSSVPFRKIEAKTLVILRMGLYQIIYMDKVPDSAAVNESVRLAKKQRLYKSSGFINGVLRGFLRAGKKYTLPDESDKASYLSVKYSCPEKIISLWLDSYGENITLGILSSLSSRPPLFARVNTLKTDADSLITRLSAKGISAEKSPFLQTALSVENTGSIERLDEFRQGLFYIQDLSSQLCVSFLKARPGNTVIDVCSAPGGKSMGIAIDMRNTGQVLSFDMYENKIRLINSAAKRLGLTAVKASVRNAQTGTAELPSAGIVLCDVPCSGLGIIRRKPEIPYKKDILDNNLPRIQYEILKNSAELVAPGGVLAYTTCTLNPRENAENADKFLTENSNFEPLPVELPNNLKRGTEEPENQLTLFPHLNGTDGFYISLFRKRG